MVSFILISIVAHTKYIYCAASEVLTHLLSDFHASYAKTTFLWLKDTVYFYLDGREQRGGG